MAFGAWVNGVATDQISINDRGLSYGDGLFTTMLVSNGSCCLLPEHLSRLQDGIKRLAIAQIDFSQLLEQLTTAANVLEHGIIKVVITRGAGARGYSSLACDTPTVIVTTSPLPSHYPALRKKGINVGVSTIALGLNPVTAGLKHLNRLEQVLVRQQIDQEGWDDAIVLDCQGYIVESNLANIFWLKDGTLYTPSLEFAGVEGIMRNAVLAQAQAMNYQISIDRYRLSSVMDSDEIFITNSLMQVVPITMVEQRHYPIGSHTLSIAAAVVIEDGSH